MMEEKSLKKSKHKKHKKKNRHEKKKANNTEECKRQEERQESRNSGEAFGPALPPHLVQQQQSLQRTATSTIAAEYSNEERAPAVIGPIIPKEYQKLSEHSVNDNSNNSDNDNNDDTDMYGPLPNCTKRSNDSKHLKLEERALQLKMAAIDGTFPSSSNTTETGREEWMLELPDVGPKTGLAALGNIKRGFYQGKDNRDFSDRSSWTIVPNTISNANKPSTSKQIQENLRKEAVAEYEKRRDEEQEIAAKKHKKKYKREESLVNMHQKKLAKERKERERKLLKEAGKGGTCKSERRPFSRDVDLKLNKIDHQLTKQIVDKAKILDTKFSSGAIKYL